MIHRILIVDSNEAFATMLQESLEQGGEYSASVTTSGDGALQELGTSEFDMVIIDMGLTDPDGATIARMLRQQRANLRLMLIPLVGEELPPELADLDVQGVLPKPFFLPELPGRIANALARPMVGTPDTAEGVEPDTASSRLAVSSAEGTDVPPEYIPEIVQEMTVLSQEINAEAVILTCERKLIAHTGRLSAEEAGELAQAVAESWHTSARVAQILGQEQLRFEQSVDGGEHMFYSLAIAEGIIISAALRASVPLGIIRHRAKETAEVLRTLISASQ
jgi:CheY-like chemotaxis protein